eukprot:evm.model.scf_178.5 EVM.evm.TU.scf_178.5   scf_178:57168-57914(-)
MANIAPLSFLRCALMQRTCGGLGARGFASEAAVDDRRLEVDVREFKGHNVEVPGNRVATFKGDLLSVFRLVFTMRRFEEASHRMYRDRPIRGFCRS